MLTLDLLSLFRDSDGSYTQPWVGMMCQHEESNFSAGSILTEVGIPKSHARALQFDHAGFQCGATCPTTFPDCLLFPLYRCSNSDWRGGVRHWSTTACLCNKLHKQLEMNKADVNFLHASEGAACTLTCHFEACYRVMYFCVETGCTQPPPL